MQELPDLSQLSHSEIDDLIHLLWSMLQSQTKQIAALQAQVADSQSQRNKNSRNSSPPPEAMVSTNPHRSHGVFQARIQQADKRGTREAPCAKPPSPTRSLSTAYQTSVKRASDNYPLPMWAKPDKSLICPHCNLRSPNTTPCKPSVAAGMCIRESFLRVSVLACNMAHALKPRWCTSIKTTLCQYSAQPR